VLAQAVRNCLDPGNVFSAPPLTPVVKKLIITLFAAFVLELLLRNFARVDIVRYLALDPVNPNVALLFTQLLTYVVIEAPQAAEWFLINLVFMWLIMSPFEAAFGRRHTLELIALGALGGSLATVLVAQLAPIPGYRLVGSHTIAYAGMAAMTQVMGGGRRILLFGVFSMTSRQLVILLVVIPVLNYLVTQDHLGLASSLGAMLAGGGYVKYMARAPRPSLPKRPSTARFRVVRGGGGRSSDPDRDSDSDRPKWLN
jgi:membrane associated rhomboid family serine protease